MRITLINFHVLNQPFIPGINLTWSWCIISLLCFWVQPWLVWLSGLSASRRTEGSLVQYPVRAHVQVPIGGGGHVRGNHTLMFLSLSLSLPLWLKIIKWNIFKKYASGFSLLVFCWGFLSPSLTLRGGWASWLGNRSQTDLMRSQCCHSWWVY